MSLDDQTGRAIARVHDELSHDVTVTNYVYDPDAGANEYADGDWVETDASPQTVSARIEFPGRHPLEREGPGGGATERDATIYVEHGVVPVHTGEADETRATEFTDSRSGTTYRAIGTDHQSDLLAVHVAEV